MTDESKAGRKSTYTDALGELICDQLASGNTLKSICAHPGMPSERTVHYWLTDEDKTAFLQSYRGAKLVQYDVLFDSTIDIARGDRNNDSQVKIQRDTLEIKTIHHYVSKLKPSKYGDRVIDEDTPVSNELDFSQWNKEQYDAYKALVAAATVKKNGDD